MVNRTPRSAAEKAQHGPDTIALSKENFREQAYDPRCMSSIGNGRHRSGGRRNDEFSGDGGA